MIVSAALSEQVNVGVALRAYLSGADLRGLDEELGCTDGDVRYGGVRKYKR